MADTSVRIKTLEMKNPVMPASGAYDYFDHNANVFPVSDLGAVMVKSVHRMERPGNPAPRVTEVVGGMINAVGIPSIGIERWMKEEYQRYTGLGTKLVLSISGSSSEQYYEALEIVNDAPGIDAIEVNFSCPNVGSGLAFSSDPVVLKDVVTGCRARTKLPMFAKLTPCVTDIKATALAAQEGGADAVTLSNTFRAMCIDIRTGKPNLGNISGGMSGPAVKPQNMYLVYQAYKVLNIPIIAVGGISNWKDAVEYIMAGATALQVGCINFTNPMAMKEIIVGIEQFMDKNGYKTLEDFRGIAHNL